MKCISTIEAFRRFRSKVQGKVVFVPTMGALHEGHADLIRRARKLAGTKGTVVVSIFVNPTQFGPNEDFSRYPRPLSADLKICRSLGVDAVWNPDPATMYPGTPSVFVDENRLSSGLCGASRPGHFRGVCTVVAKLFLLVQPQIAVFGEKDYQQLAIIRQMVLDLNFPIEIVGAPTYRESDGLAMSSRNRYLTPEERKQAPVLRQALLEAQAALPTETSAVRLRKRVVKLIEKASLAKIDYVEVVHAKTLQPIRQVTEKSVIAVAVFFGKTRLIDNIELRP